ncbi:ankyrin repeat domain-containing protein [Candidatus Endoriftia persephonae]|jgi:ankyrin repeat protein|uniref:Ankyrin n=2 Tax=Gammaproteobacteria TaxID=1236 RepID=G2FB90_9GAMM|nr:ankyrin repeat domain-containing protein [Candidatus Endoriftia persephone]EGW56028.1 ankyrin [endosymbiont of Tevnia jerichonana (vent Tica)]USF88151.1 ankyrin repeat domain-containing protein [Candidatus Endoriftia persephone]
MKLHPILLPSLLALLLMAGCSKPDRPTINLYRAVHVGDIDQIERNLYWDADINATGPDGRTPLHVAAERGLLVVVSILLDHGADIDAKNTFGKSPIYTAVMARRPLIARQLADQGAQFEPNEMLIEAVRSNSASRDIIEFLIKRGAKINVTDKDGNTPLHIAVLQNHRVIVKHLIAKGAEVNQRNHAGQTALQLAIANNSEAIIAILHKYGAVAGKPDM